MRKNLATLFDALFGDPIPEGEKVRMLKITKEQAIDFFASKPAEEVIGYAGDATHCPLANCIRAVNDIDERYNITVNPDSDQRKYSQPWEIHLARTVDARHGEGDPVTAGEALAIIRDYQDNGGDGASA